jgi:GH25 family lysozyme M1 (1,4-beta-N-acetylmuramidase)
MKFNPVIVDLSHFDDVQDWDLVRSFGILGVINKATEGPGMTDKTFAIRRKPAVIATSCTAPIISYAPEIRSRRQIISLRWP